MRLINIAVASILLACMYCPAFASIVPITDELLVADFRSESGSRYVDGYVKLNRTQGNIALILQPVMPACPVNGLCTEETPAAFEYFLEEVTSSRDLCGAMIYEAQQDREHRIKVTLIDNTHYDNERCPTFLPVPLTVVQVEQTFHSPESTERVDAYFAGDALSPLRY